MNEQSTVIRKTEKPNSYEFGKPGNRFKIYFEDAKDLRKTLKELEDEGFGVDEEWHQNIVWS